MSEPHLSHKVAWSDMIDYYTPYKDNGVVLSTGKCGRIHLINKQTKLQVEHRKYLNDKICLDTSCETTGSNIFRKTQQRRPFSLDRPRTRDPDRAAHRDKFLDDLARAIREFGQTERKKVDKRTIANPKDKKAFREEIIKQLKEKGQWLPPEEDKRRYDYRHCDCKLFTMLMEAGDTKTLLSFSDEEIRSALGCQHGGQAVGNNIRFLLYRVVRVYVWTNLIIATGIHNQPEKWGPMNPHNNRSWFRHELMHDCDGQTFLSHSRKFLTDDVYMKDLEVMRQLSKNCFRFLYFYDMLQMEVNGKWTLGDHVDGYFYSFNSLKDILDEFSDKFWY